MRTSVAAAPALPSEGEAALLSAIEASRPVAGRYARPGRCADDLVSVATVRLVEKAAQLLAHPAPIAFARVAARRAVVDYIRRNAHDRRTRGGPALDDLPAAARDAREAPAFTFGELLALANTNDRELLSLRFRDGLRHDQVAQRLGLSHECVRARLSRTLRRLRKRIGEDDRGG
jgi:RNA polymerase sigma factor (sigma-70 family)